MIYLADNKEIGFYLKEQISSKYKSKRQFYKDYIKLKYNMSDSDPMFLDNLKTEENRFNQILSGRKGVQTHDLPHLSNVLGISYEEILSAGKNAVVINMEVDKTPDIKKWKNPICPECGYKFAYLNEELCPLCGTMNPYYEKEFIENEGNIINEEEFDSLDDKFKSKEFDADILRYEYYLHSLLKENDFNCYEIAKTYSTANRLVFRNVKKAIYWAEKGVVLGDTRCNELLGDIYLTGEGIIKDVSKAIFWLEKGLEDPKCVYALAQIYYKEEGYKNIDKAVKLLKTLCLVENGQCTESAIEDLGIIYYEEYKEYETAFKYLNQIKESYSSELNYYIGECYFHGRGVKQNYEKAVWYYQKGKRTDEKSDIRMAECYLKGLGVEQNATKAIKIYDSLINYYENRDEEENVTYIKKMKSQVGGCD